MSAPPPQERGAWPHLRALFVALHLVAILLAAAPAPEGAMRRQAWKDPTVQDELRTWAERLRSLDPDLDDQEFEEALWVLAVELTDARRAVLAPFQPYYRYLGTHQSWRMFIAPHRYPARLHLDLRQDGAWRPLYIARDPDAAWRGGILDHDRLRSAIFRYAWRSYRRPRQGLQDWLARQAAADFPEATHLRFRYWKQRTPSPAEVEAGKEPPGRWIFERELELEPYRSGTAL